MWPGLARRSCGGPRLRGLGLPEDGGPRSVEDGTREGGPRPGSHWAERLPSFLPHRASPRRSPARQRRRADPTRAGPRSRARQCPSPHRGTSVRDAAHTVPGKPGATGSPGRTRRGASAGRTNAQRPRTRRARSAIALRPLHPQTGVGSPLEAHSLGDEPPFHPDLLSRSRYRYGRFGQYPLYQAAGGGAGPIARPDLSRNDGPIAIHQI